MNLRVKLLLSMINGLRPGAKAAQKDLQGVGSAAKALDKVKAGDKLARDIKKIGDNAKVATRDILALGSAAKKSGDAAAAASAKNARAQRDMLLLATPQGKKRASATPIAQPAPRRQRSKEKEESGGTTLIPGSRGAIAGVTGYVAARAAVRRTVGESVAFEKAMADVKKKVDLSPGDTWQDVERTISDVALRLGRSRAESAALAAELGASGTQSKNLAADMELTARAAVAWDMSLGEAGEKLSKIRTQHQLSTKELEEFGDQVNALADSGASKERDVVEMFQRAAAAAKTADVNRTTSLAFLTGMNSAGMQDEVASRGFAAMVSKLRTAKTSGGKKMKEGLAMLGLTPAQVEKGMRDDSQKMLLEIIDRFAKAKDKAAAAVKMFGEGWWDEFARMAQAAPEIAKNLKLLHDPSKWRGSMQKSLNIELATTANHLERLKVQVAEIGDRLGRWALPPINASIDAIMKKLDELDKEAEDRKKKRELANKIANKEALTPEDIAAAANDPELQRRVHAARAQAVAGSVVAAESENRAFTPAERERARDEVSSLEAEIQQLRAKQSDPKTPLHERGGITRRLQEKEFARGRIQSRVDAADVHRRTPADQADRAANVGELSHLSSAVDALQQRVDNLSKLAALYPRNRQIENDLVDAQHGLGKRRAQMRGAIPNNFGAGKKTMPGATGGKETPSINTDFARTMRARLQPDLAPDGGLIMDQLRSGIEGGASKVGAAADGAREAIERPFRGMDLAAEGQAAMNSLAAGITAGTPAAVAAMTSAKARIAAAARGAGGGLGNALHDGVTGQ